MAGNVISQNPVAGTSVPAGTTVAILKEITNGLSYGLSAHDDVRRPAGYINVAGTDRFAIGTVQLALNAWTHLAATYDGTTLRLYVNGIQVGTRASTGSMTTSSNALRIGGNTIWGEYFTGLIDDIRIHNRALTATEIQELMTVPMN